MYFNVRVEDFAAALGFSSYIWLLIDLLYM